MYGYLWEKRVRANTKKKNQLRNYDCLEEKYIKVYALNVKYMICLKNVSFQRRNIILINGIQTKDKLIFSHKKIIMERLVDA